MQLIIWSREITREINDKCRDDMVYGRVHFESTRVSISWSIMYNYGVSTSCVLGMDEYYHLSSNCSFVAFLILSATIDLMAWAIINLSDRWICPYIHRFSIKRMLTKKDLDRFWDLAQNLTVTTRFCRKQFTNIYRQWSVTQGLILSNFSLLTMNRLYHHQLFVSNTEPGISFNLDLI